MTPQQTLPPTYDGARQERADQRAPAPRYRALVIGISDYPWPIPKLPGVANDGREMAKLLGSGHGTFKSHGVRVLADAEATHKAILAAIETTFAGTESDDTVFAYLAGHGAVEGDGYHFVAHDTNPEAISTTGVPLHRIKAAFDASLSKRAFLWLDFCHSGGIVGRSLRTEPDDRTAINRALQVVQGQGKVIFAGCSPFESAWENATIGHGLFTYALLRGLKGEAADNGEVTINSLFEYVCKQLPAKQTPMMFGLQTGRIVLMHSVDARLSRSDSSHPAPERQNPKSGDVSVPPRSPILLSVKKRFPFYYRGRVLSRGHTDMVSCVAMTPAGNGAVSGSADQTVRYWDLDDKTPHSRIIGEHGFIVRGVALAPLANRAVSASDDNCLAVWHIKSEILRRNTFEASNGRVQCVAVTADGRRAVTGSEGGTVSIWDLDEGTSFDMPKGHQAEVLCVAITPDGRRVVSGSADNTVCVWTVGSCDVAVLTNHAAAVRGVAISSKGDRTVSASSDQRLCVWDVPDSDQPVSHTWLEGHEDEVLCVAMTPDGIFVVSGSADTTVRVWRVATGKEVAVLEGHEKSVLGVAITADGYRVLSGSEDNTVRVWDQVRQTSRSHFVTIRDSDQRLVDYGHGVRVKYLVQGTNVGGTKEVSNLTTGLSIYHQNGGIPYHTHTVDEVLIVLRGNVPIRVAGRLYVLGERDAIHIPAHGGESTKPSVNTAHFSWNSSSVFPEFLWAISAQVLTRELCTDKFIEEYCKPIDDPLFDATNPECIARFKATPSYEVGQGCHFKDLFSKENRKHGICAGYVLLEARCSTPQFQNEYDACVRVMKGKVVCSTTGQRETLVSNESVFVPSGLIYELGNPADEEAEILWICGD